MASAKGGSAEDGAAGKGVKGKEAFIAKAAGAVIATGIAWSVYKSLNSRKDEVELIGEYYDSNTREEYTPNGLSSTVIELESDAKEKIDDVKSTAETTIQELESEVSSKPVFFFGRQKKKASKPKSKLSETYEINKGDTLYGISRKYGLAGVIYLEFVMEEPKEIQHGRLCICMHVLRCALCRECANILDWLHPQLAGERENVIAASSYSAG